MIYIPLQSRECLHVFVLGSHLCASALVEEHVSGLCDDVAFAGPVDIRVVEVEPLVVVRILGKRSVMTAIKRAKVIRHGVKVIRLLH